MEDNNNQDGALFALEAAGEYAVQNLFAIVHNRFTDAEHSERLSQQQLANRMGLTRSQVSRWFASPSNMTLRSAAKLLAAMGRRLELADVEPHSVATSQEISKPGATIHHFPVRAPVTLALAAARKTQDRSSKSSDYEPVAILARATAEGRLVFRDADVFLELPANETAKRLRLGSVGYDLEPAGEGLFKVLGLKPGEARRACEAAQYETISWA